MHSPEVVAFNIRRPWPKRDKTFDRRRQWSWRPPYFTFAGREWRFPELITVWHNEPGGHDALSVCGRQSHWQCSTAARKRLRAVARIPSPLMVAACSPTTTTTGSAGPGSCTPPTSATTRALRSASAGGRIERR